MLILWAGGATPPLLVEMLKDLLVVSAGGILLYLLLRVYERRAAPH